VSVRVASWPHWYEPNVYLPLFYDALAQYGVEHVANVPLDKNALLDPANAVSVLHIHWPYPIWQRGRRSPRQLLRIARLWRLLSQLRRSGIRIVWTVHNVQSQDGGSFVDRLGQSLLYKQADLCIFHSNSAVAQARVLYGDRTKATLVMPHGNYDGALPTPAARAQTLRALGLPPERKILLCFGQIRSYKGFDRAVQAMHYLPADAFHLVIAGRLMLPESQVLGEAQHRHPNVTVLWGDMEEQRLADLLEAADVVLLPYRDLTSSGALLHALTAGKGVVATDLPYFREVLSNAPEAGVLVRNPAPETLAAAIREFFTISPVQRGRAARELASTFDWQRVVAPVAEWLLRHSTPSTG
jgi:beta-1,4-mannosyltransferase